MAKAKAKRSLTALDILGAKPELTKIDIEGLNGSVYVKEFTAKTRKAYVEAINNETDAHAVVIVNGVCDEDGEPLFEPEDVIKLQELRSDIHDQLFNAVLKLSTDRIKASAKK